MAIAIIFLFLSGRTILTAIKFIYMKSTRLKIIRGLMILFIVLTTLFLILYLTSDIQLYKRLLYPSSGLMVISAYLYSWYRGGGRRKN